MSTKKAPVLEHDRMPKWERRRSTRNDRHKANTAVRQGEEFTDPHRVGYAEPRTPASERVLPREEDFKPTREYRVWKTKMWKRRRTQRGLRARQMRGD